MPEVPEVPWGHRVGLMSLLMIHKAYMPVYSDPDFSCGTGRDGTNEPTEGSTRGPRGPKNFTHKESQMDHLKKQIPTVHDDFV